MHSGFRNVSTSQRCDASEGGSLGIGLVAHQPQQEFRPFPLPLQWQGFGLVASQSQDDCIRASYKLVQRGGEGALLFYEGLLSLPSLNCVSSLGVRHTART